MKNNTVTYIVILLSFIYFAFGIINYAFPDEVPEKDQGFTYPYKEILDNYKNPVTEYCRCRDNSYICMLVIEESKHVNTIAGLCVPKKQFSPEIDDPDGSVLVLE